MWSEQYVEPKRPFSDEDEIKQGVWGYLHPCNERYGERCVVLRKRDRVLPEDNGGFPHSRPEGYLIGRHPECGKFLSTTPH